MLLPFLIFVAALLYASVGHGGASGYLAMMALVGTVPDVMKPAALALNVIVATIGTRCYMRAGAFRWRALWPFLIGSIPLAYWGGGLQSSERLWRIAVGGVLVVAALRMATVRGTSRDENPRPSPAIGLAIPSGGAIGFLAGFTGTGGGIFLSPLLILARWARTRETAGVSAAFILCNSIAGLAARPASLESLPGTFWLWASAAALGGLLGAELGSRRFSPPILRRLLAVVLAIAAVKLIATR
jgi:uncharacterized membrane protein YfcA